MSCSTNQLLISIPFGLDHSSLASPEVSVKFKGLRLGGFALLFCQIGLAGIGIDDLRHLVQDQLLALLVQLPGSDGGAVLPGVGPFIFGVVERRVVGDGDDTGALRRRQVLSGLAGSSIPLPSPRRRSRCPNRSYSGTAPESGFSCCSFQIPAPGRLPDLAVDGILILAGHVFFSICWVMVEAP